MKPANNETGEPNPKNGKTHNIVNNKNNRDNIKMLFFLIFEKYSILSFINSYEESSCKLNLENR